MVVDVAKMLHAGQFARQARFIIFIADGGNMMAMRANRQRQGKEVSSGDEHRMSRCRVDVWETPV